jgi:hypothetical protein
MKEPFAKLTRIRWAVVFCALVALAFGGCGPSLSLTVPDDLLQRLPKSSRRSVFQAETVVTIAIDRRGAIKRLVDSTLREIDRIGEKVKQVEAERSKASSDKRSRYDLEIAMLEAKVDYLHELIDHQDIQRKLADWELVLAKAQFELAKVRLVKKHSIAYSGTIEEFEAQVNAIRADVDGLRKDVDKEVARLKVEEDKWLASKKRYYSSIGESSKGWWTEQ